MKRIRDAEAKNILIRKFRECFEQGINAPIDREKDLDLARYGNEITAYIAKVNELNDQDAYARKLVDQTIEYYKTQVQTQIDQYKKGITTDASLGSKALESLDGVYWLPNSIINNYTYIAH